MPHVGFLTYTKLPHGSPDDQPIIQLLNASGIYADFVVWDDPALWVEDYDLLVIRSIWDYHLRLPAFMEWLTMVEHKEITLLNPSDVVRWNMDKRYLSALEEGGALIVPTMWIEQGSPASLESLMAERDWQKAVVKPIVSASAHETWTTEPHLAAAHQARFFTLLEDNTLMLQPFIPEIQTEEEWSLIFIDGSYSHAVIKRPQAGDFRSQVEFGSTISPVEASLSIIQQAEAVLGLVTQPVLYARVDGIVRDGQFMLMELELIEPHLFLATSQTAAAHLANAIQRVLDDA